jgi:hypothetical protein
MCGYAIGFDHDVRRRLFARFAAAHARFRPRRSSKRRTIARGSSRSLLEQRARALAHQPPFVPDASLDVIASTIYIIDDDEACGARSRLLSAVDFPSGRSRPPRFLAGGPGLDRLPIADVQLVGMSGSTAEPHGQRELAHADHRDERLARQQIESAPCARGRARFCASRSTPRRSSTPSRALTLRRRRQNINFPEGLLRPCRRLEALSQLRRSTWNPKPHCSS